jgi:hypothetical protein
VSYVDAGYSICLTVLFLYGVSLILRRRRLLRAVDVAERDVAKGDVAKGGVAKGGVAKGGVAKGGVAKGDAIVMPTGAVPNGVAGIDVGNER